MDKIAIIGAGISALTIAHQLKDKAHITLFEKSRSTGGRLCTRRAKLFHFDHGAQFFTVKSEIFQAFITPMINQGIIQPWQARFLEYDQGIISKQRQWNDKDAHFVGCPTMSAIGKYLKKTIENEATIVLNTQVAKVEKDLNDTWALYDNKQSLLGYFDWVICTTPAKQAEAVIPKSFAYFKAIENTTMLACFSLMLGFEKPLNLPFEAALIRHKDISWISVNSSKPLRETPFTLLVHSSNQWASEHIDDDQDSVIKHLLVETSAVIGEQIYQYNYQAIQGFRYANIAKQKGSYFLFDRPNQLAVCGDWLIQGRVEAAFLSGYYLSNHLNAFL